MANVSCEAEFMKQWLPSLPISNAKSFQVVRDEQSRPIIFSIGTTGTLSALLPGGTNGQYVRLDLENLFGLSTPGVASSLFVSQDKDLKIYVTFAVDGAKAGDPSALYVVHPTMPGDWQTAIMDPKKAPLLLKDESTEKRLIKQLHLAGAADATAGYPLVVVLYSAPNGSKKLDAACLDINVSGGTWKYADTFELPETPNNMKDMCAGALPAGINGLFCLYDSQGETRLSFASFKGGPYHQPHSTSLRPPPGAQCLATFVNKKGFTDLLIGGDAVYHYTTIAATHSDPLNGPDRFVRVTSDSDPYLKQLHQITVAQDPSHDALCIYGRNKDGTVVYQQCNISFPTSATATLSLDGTSIPLLARAQGGGAFTVLLNKATGSQKLFIVGTDNTLTCMEQSGGTRLWQRTVMLLPSIKENTEITSYTSHIQVTGQDGAPLANTTFLLCSSSAIDLGSNGVPISATASGVLVSTDESGDITLIQNVAGLSSVVFTLKDDPQAANPVLGKSYILNPAAKVQQILGTIKTPEDARNARLPNGHTVLDSGSANSDYRDKAAEALPLLCQILGRMPQDGSEHPEAVAAAGYYETTETSDWGIFEWLHTAIDDVEHFAVDAWHLAVTFAGKIYKFVLKSLPHVLKALHWLLQDVLGIPIDTITEWLGFLFHWDDIHEMHNILATIVNTGIDYAIAKTNDFETIVNGWFKKGDDMLKSLDSISNDIKSRKIGSNSYNTQSVTEADTALFTKTPGRNWSTYQVKHGGVGNSLRAQKSERPSNDPLLQFWEDVAEPALKKVCDAVVDAIQNLAKLFSSNKELSIEQLLQHLGVQLLREILAILRSIMVGVIKFIADFAKDVKTLINKSIDIPLLTPLYRWISQHDLTMLDAVALLIAVPATMFCKEVTKKKPGDLPGVKEFLDAYKVPHLRFMASLSATETASSPSNNALLTSTDGVPYASDSTSDDLFTKCKSVASRVASIIVPPGNFLALLLAPADWYTPGQVGNSWWGVKIVFGVLVSACTFPYDDIPGHSDLRLLREFAWGVSVLSIPASPTGPRIRGIVSLAAGCLQCAIEISSIHLAIKSAEDHTYGGNLDSEDVWLDICDRLLATIGKSAGGVCMIMNKPEPYTPIVALQTSYAAIACEVMKAIRYDPQAKASMPQASLCGIS